MTDRRSVAVAPTQPVLAKATDEDAAWPWKTTAEEARPIAPCGEPCPPEGCMARGCPVAR